jgi:predicted Rossmann fold flavoprotein
VPDPNATYDITVIGAGAAGLMAAIWTARTAAPGTRILALDGAKKLGAKILVAGGGRCNVTHHKVDERAFAGSSPHAIKKILRQFDVPRTIAFFQDLGVELKREDTGKLFPTTDDAHTVLSALLAAAHAARVELIHPWRVGPISRTETGFLIEPEPTPPTSSPRNSAPSAPSAFSSLLAKRVILATGGKSLPKTGSDGAGYELAKSLGHTITPHTFPGLVPLTLPKGHFITELSGLTVPAAIDLRSATGKRLKSFTNSTLCTHFGLSGPSVLDISRYYTAAKLEDPEAHLVMNWLPPLTPDHLEALLQTARSAKHSIARLLTSDIPHPTSHIAPLPDRLARALCHQANIDPTAPLHTLTREARRALVRWLTQTPLPITGDRGYTHAEVTAGGVPLSELHLETMESRLCPGLHLCGEILDVDGRIGGFNFQWAWASGYVAGRAAARASSPA